VRNLTESVLVHGWMLRLFNVSYINDILDEKLQTLCVEVLFSVSCRWISSEKIGKCDNKD